MIVNNINLNSTYIDIFISLYPKLIKLKILEFESESVGCAENKLCSQFTCHYVCSSRKGNGIGPFGVEKRRVTVNEKRSTPAFA